MRYRPRNTRLLGANPFNCIARSLYGFSDYFQSYFSEHSGQIPWLTSFPSLSALFVRSSLSGHQAQIWTTLEGLFSIWFIYDGDDGTYHRSGLFETSFRQFVEFRIQVPELFVDFLPLVFYGRRKYRHDATAFLETRIRVDDVFHVLSLGERRIHYDSIETQFVVCEKILFQRSDQRILIIENLYVFRIEFDCEKVDAQFFRAFNDSIENVSDSCGRLENRMTRADSSEIYGEFRNVLGSRKKLEFLDYVGNRFHFSRFDYRPQRGF